MDKKRPFTFNSTVSIGYVNTLNFKDNVKSLEFSDLYFLPFGEGQTATVLDTLSKKWATESIKKIIF